MKTANNRQTAEFYKASLGLNGQDTGDTELPTTSASHDAARQGEEALRSAAQAYEKLNEARNLLQSAAKDFVGDLKQDAEDEILDKKQTVDGAINQARSFVKEKPGAAIGYAFAAGALAALLLK